MLKNDCPQVRFWQWILAQIGVKPGIPELMNEILNCEGVIEVELGGGWFEYHGGMIHTPQGVDNLNIGSITNVRVRVETGSVETGSVETAPEEPVLEPPAPGNTEANADNLEPEPENPENPENSENPGVNPLRV